MPPERGQTGAWRRLVLGSQAPPAWLREAGPHSEVVLSTRVRAMRNLAGHRFPHHAGPDELQEVASEIVGALDGPLPSGRAFSIVARPTPAEREYLVACRLASPDFAWFETGRALLVDGERESSLMVNEEDHIRLQALTPGWSIARARDAAGETLDRLSASLRFAWSPRFGFLSSSPYNCGGGIRLSAMFHLIGLAHVRRLHAVLKALAGRGIVARGLFGESSRGIGAFLQVSVTQGPKEDFSGAGAYLLDEEARARAEVSPDELSSKVRDGCKAIQGSLELGLPDAMRLLAWIRWAASAEIPGFEFGARAVDNWFPSLVLLASNDEAKAGRLRAEFLREELGL